MTKEHIKKLLEITRWEPIAQKVLEYLENKTSFSVLCVCRKDYLETSSNEKIKKLVEQYDYVFVGEKEPGKSLYKLSFKTTNNNPFVFIGLKKEAK